jgi:hypothetical protein
MKGHEAIIATRMESKKPVMVFLCADGYSAVDTTPKNPLADLVIFPHEDLECLDLRFLVGLTVSISGENHSRVTAVTESCIKAKAKRVISNYATIKHTPYGPVSELVRVDDTEGVLQWEEVTW